ncbi:MarR family winged helix-turn-helix transcriptional regulator [Herbiconiux sp. UC225_62]|uniref:MarR family winged helix-turn-helix transcriptional regulator n=1 Tax=Herbiconiux sp. UC225_62 TaxID=3350168 RepID=UPI0036D2B7C8
MENSRATTTRARKSPTAHELRVWRDFVETGDRIRSLLAARLQSESGLSTGDYAVLLALSEAEGKRLRSSDLAAVIDWERSRLSHHLGRMEARGLVVREPCATDNRGAEVVLTAAGASQFRRASASHLRAVQELFVDAFASEDGGASAGLESVETVTEALQKHLRP